jgi:hypothetical protein
MAKRQYVLVEFGWCVAWVIASIVAAVVSVAWLIVDIGGA